MTSYIDIGDKASNQVDIVQVSVDIPSADSVVVKVASGDTLNVYTDTHSNAASTITATNSATFTAPVWLASQGRSTVQITGGKY